VPTMPCAGVKPVTDWVPVPASLGGGVPLHVHIESTQLQLFEP